MFFLIRSVFWLSIVFSSMTWAVDATQPARPHALRDAVVESGLAFAGAAKEAALAQARSWCIKSPEQCMADAAQLTALIVASQNDDADAATFAPDPIPAIVPLPHPDPRRRPAFQSAASPRG